MSVEIRNSLYILLIACLCLLLWGGSAAGTFFDLRRRNLSALEQTAWLSLVAVLPGLGFAAYLLSRLLAFVFTPAGKTRRPDGIKRVTLLKRQDEAKTGSGTVPAAELVRRTIPEQKTPDLPQGRGTETLEYIHLTVQEGPHAGEEITLEALPATIGREPGSAVQLEKDRRVSRLHSEFYRRGNTIRIRDLRSTHGTYVNGYSIDDKALGPGDRIEVGISLIQVEVG